MGHEQPPQNGSVHGLRTWGCTRPIGPTAPYGGTALIASAGALGDSAGRADSAGAAPAAPASRGARRAAAQPLIPLSCTWAAAAAELEARTGRIGA